MNNYLLISVKGKNIYKFLIRCKNNNINLISVKRISPRELLIKINYSDYDKLLKIKSIYKLEIINKYGFIKIKELILKYRCFFISFFIGLMFLLFLSNIIFKINIVSDNNSLNKKVLKDLEALGIKKYSFRKNYEEIEDIKQKILDKYNDSVEWIEINRKGVVYEVQIVERKKNKKTKKDNYVNIVAKKSGVIRKILAEDGTKVVDIDTYVNKGDIIISGVLKKGEDVKGLVHAKGKVYAEVWYNVNIEYPLYYTEKRYTDNERKSFYIKLGDKYFNLKKYKNMDRESIVNLKNRLVPFEIGIEKQYEYKLIKDKLSISEARNKAFLKAKNKLVSTLDKDEYITFEKTLNFYEKNSKIVLKIFFSSYEEIGIEEEIFIE